MTGCRRPGLSTCPACEPARPQAWRWRPRSRCLAPAWRMESEGLGGPSLQDPDILWKLLGFRPERVRGHKRASWKGNVDGRGVGPQGERSIPHVTSWPAQRGQRVLSAPGRCSELPSSTLVQGCPRARPALPPRFDSASPGRTCLGGAQRTPGSGARPPLDLPQASAANERAGQRSHTSSDTFRSVNSGVNPPIITPFPQEVTSWLGGGRGSRVEGGGGRLPGSHTFVLTRHCQGVPPSPGPMGTC